MRHRGSSSAESGGRAKDGDSSDKGIDNIRTKPPHIYDNITRRLLQLGITLGVTTFVGLLVRYAVKEFDPSVSTITVTTARVDNRDIASLSVSKNFLERILEFIGESISIVAVIIPLGFPVCTIFNRHFAKIRAGSKRFEFKSQDIFSMIPKYLIIGDALACHMPSTAQPQTRLRPLVRDTIYHLIRARLKPKLIVEDSYEEARRLGIRIGLIKRDHHRLAVIKSVDLLKNITDSRGDIKQGRVRYLLSRMKIMSQSTPADKSLLIYLIKHCEPMPNENLAYLGYSFTDPEAMRLADCALTFADCDEEDVKRSAQVLLKSDSNTFTDIYLFLVVCLITSNITQSYALYQISASVSACIYRFLSITIFQEQLVSHSQFVLLIFIQQLFAILALMTKWLSSLPQMQMRTPVAEMSHAATDDSLALDLGAESSSGSASHAARRHSRQHSPKKQQHHHRRSSVSLTGAGGATGTGGMLLLEPSLLARHTSASDRERRSLDDDDDHHFRGPTTTTMSASHGPRRWTYDDDNDDDDDDTLGSSTSLSDGGGGDNPLYDGESSANGGQRSAREKHRHRRASRPTGGAGDNNTNTTSSLSRHSTAGGGGGSAHMYRVKKAPSDEAQPVHLTGVDLDQAIINSKIATNYRQTFHNSSLIDDVTYRLAKLHIAYQILVMIIIMIFGNAMFQLNMNNNRQHQTLAFNSLVMNNIFNLANCFNQFGEFNLRSGFRNHPFFLCVLLLAVALQVTLSELNAFGLENLNPTQWFVCFVFALMSALIAPLTGQQARTGVSRGLPQTTQRDMNTTTTTHRMMSPKGTELMDEVAQQHRHHHHNRHHHHHTGKHNHHHNHHQHHSSSAQRRPSHSTTTTTTTAATTTPRHRNHRESYA